MGTSANSSPKLGCGIESDCFNLASRSLMASVNLLAFSTPASAASPAVVYPRL